MADRYWVGGSGTWNSTNLTNWSDTSNGAGGFSVPVAGDNVFFDGAVSGTITNTGAKSFQDITVSGSNITIAGTGAMAITGNITLTSTTQWTGTGTLTFSNTTQKTINTNGVSIAGSTTFTTVGSSWIFASAFTTEKNFTQNNGILNFANFNITCETFSSINSNLRSIIMGSSNVYLTSTTSGATVLNISTMTNLTFTSTTGSFVSNADTNKTFTFGATGVTNITKSAGLTFTGSGSGVATLTNGSYFKTLDFGSTTFTVPTTSVNLLSNLTLGNGTYIGLTPVFSGSASCTINGNGKTIPTLALTFGANSITLAGNLTVSGTTTLTSGTLNLNGFVMQSRTLSSNNTNVRSIDFSSGSFILNSPINANLCLDMGTATGFTCTGTGGFTVAQNFTGTFTFGTTGGSSTNAPNLSVIGGTIGPSISSGSWFNKLDYSATALGPGTTSVNLNSLILGSGTFTGLSVTMNGTGNLNGNGKTLAELTISNGSGITTTLASALTVSGTTTLTSGTLNLGGFTLTTGTFSSSNSSTRSITFGAANIVFTDSVNMATATNFTLSATTGGFAVQISSAASKYFIFAKTDDGGSALNAPNLTVTGVGPNDSTPSNGGLGIGNTTSNYWLNKFDCSAATYKICSITAGFPRIFVKSFAVGPNNLALPNFILSATGTISGINPASLRFTIDHSGVTTLVGNVETGSSSGVGIGAVSLTSGTLNLAGFTFTAGNGIATFAGTKNITFNGGTLVFPNIGDQLGWYNSFPIGFTTTAGTGTGTINMTGVAGATFQKFVGGNSIYNCTLNIGSAGPLVVEGNNTFLNITNTVQPASVLFQTGSTNTFTQFNLNGTAGNLFTIGTHIYENSHTLSKASGVVNSNYLSISRSTATGGATWYAGANSTNGGNNTGWSFSSAISQITGQFMSFFF